MAAIDAAKSKTVVVFLSTKKDNQKKFPDAVRTLISSSEAGKFIPKLAITDAKAGKAIGIIAYETLKADARGALRDVLKSVEEVEKKEAKISFSPEAWTSSDGKEITATFRALSDDKVTLILSNGTATTLPLSRLSEASQKRAKECGSGGED